MSNRFTPDDRSPEPSTARPPDGPADFIGSEFSDGDWCVGTAPPRWDFCFATRLLEQFKKLWPRREAERRPMNCPEVFARRRPPADARNDWTAERGAGRRAA